MITNPLDEIISGDEADSLWAKTEPLTEEEIIALVKRQRAIRAAMQPKVAEAATDDEW